MEKIWIFVAWSLPRNLVKWCVSRVFAHATQGKWGNTIGDTLTVTEALKRWEKE